MKGLFKITPSQSKLMGQAQTTADQMIPSLQVLTKSSGAYKV